MFCDTLTVADPFPSDPRAEDTSASGADEPTAMWGPDTLKGMGLGADDVPDAHRPGSAPHAVDGRIEPGSGVSDTGSQVMRIFWPVTVAIALGCGALAYLIARGLR